MKTFSAYLGVAVLLTAIADYLLFGHPLGCGVTVFAAVLGAVLGVRYGKQTLRGGPWLLLWAALALGASLQSSVIGMAVLVTLTCAVLAKARLGQSRDILDAASSGVLGGARGFCSFFVDAARKVFWKGFDHAPYALAWVVGLPVVILVVFGALVVSANPVLTEWGRDFVDDLYEWVRRIDTPRVVFWFLFFLGGYGLLRFRPWRLELGLNRLLGASVTPPPPPPGVMVIPPLITPEMKRRYEFVSAMVTFVGLNIIFLAANVTDAAYLWCALKLPAGLTYSQYAHQGSYRLILAVVLAAVAITVFFRAGARQTDSLKARALAYFFVLQNAVVLLGAARRLELYVDVYGLTRFRVAAFLWMILVLAGFATILWKLAARKPFYFLLRANTVTVIILLSAVSFADIDGFIADWNVARYEEGMHKRIDVGYLGHLGEPAIRALVRLAGAKDREVSRQAEERLNVLIEKARDRERIWQSRTMRNTRLLRETLDRTDETGVAYPV